MKIFFKLIMSLTIFSLSMLNYATNQLNFQFLGIKGAALQNVKNRVTILQKSFNNSLSFAEVKDISQQAIPEIQKAMEPYGYFKPTITYSLIRQHENWLAIYQITPGNKLKINKIDLKVLGPGKNNSALQHFVKHFPLKIGHTLNIAKYNKAKEDFFIILNNEGYIKGYLQTNKIFINLTHNTATIVLHYQTGALYKFGKFYFSKGPYTQKFLKSLIFFPEHDDFSSEKLTSLQKRLSNSDYFQQTQVIPSFEHIKNNQVPIYVDYVAPKSQRYNLGLGYGSLTGPRLTAGIKFRRLFHSGKHFDIQLKLSSVLSRLAAKYYIPGKNPLIDQWIVGVDYQRFLPQTGASTSGTASIGYAKKIRRLQTSMNMNYMVEKYRLNTQPQEINHLLYPNINLSYVQSDNLLDPTWGKSLNFNLRGASKNIFSSTHFIQGEVKAKYLFSPTSFSHVILYGVLGYTAVHEVKNLPLSMRFFAGGTNSIRGYKDSSIGPGRFLSIGNIEYRNHLKGNWTGAVFYDFGTATNHWGTPLSNSEGLGIIYKSMIGPIKLYLAKALDRSSKPYSVEFSIGPEF